MLASGTVLSQAKHFKLGNGVGTGEAQTYFFIWKIGTQCQEETRTSKKETGREDTRYRTTESTIAITAGRRANDRTRHPATRRPQTHL